MTYWKCWFGHKFMKTFLNVEKGIRESYTKKSDFCIKCGLTKKELGI